MSNTYKGYDSPANGTSVRLFKYLRGLMAVICLTAILTNPDREAHLGKIHNALSASFTSADDTLDDFIGLLGNNYSALLADMHVSRNSYLLFSVATIPVPGNREVISIGLFDNILIIGDITRFDPSGKKIGILISGKEQKMKSIMAECDAALGSIRTELRVYYGENGIFPVARKWSYVVGESWNDIKPGELNGKYFKDNSYMYLGSGMQYRIKCKSSHLLDEGNRMLDDQGVLTFEK